MKRNHILFILGAFALVLFAAGAGAVVTKTMLNDDKVVAETKKPEKSASRTVSHKSERITWDSPRQQPQPVRVASACNDGNIVGTALGAIAGGVGGAQFGKGNGKTATTIAGTAGGAYLGNQFIPTHNITCR